MREEKIIQEIIENIKAKNLEKYRFSIFDSVPAKDQQVRIEQKDSNYIVYTVRYEEKMNGNHRSESESVFNNFEDAKDEMLRRLEATDKMFQLSKKLNIKAPYDF